MATYTVKEKAYCKELGLLEPGQKFEWEGEPLSWMLLASEAKAPVIAKVEEPTTLYAMTVTTAKDRGATPPPSSGINNILAMAAKLEENKAAAKARRK